MEYAWDRNPACTVHNDPPSDETLLQRMASGDRSALALLYDRFAPQLLGVAVRLLSNRDAAEDLVHDVMLEVWRQAADYSPQRGTVRTWLLVRLRSRALDRLRAPTYNRVVPLDELATEPAAPLVADQSDLGRVRAALDALSRDQRAVLDLAYFEGLSSSEIAGRIGVPIGTVKSRTAAALAQLRVALGRAS